MNDICFMTALPKDFDAIRDDVAAGLAELFGPGAAKGYRDTARVHVGAGLAHPQVDAYGAWADGRLCGMLIVYRESPRRAEIAFFHVLDEAAGAGVGPALVAHAVDRLREAGIQTIRADSLTFGRVDLEACFAPLGFKKMERVLMHRELPPSVGRTDDCGTRPLKAAQCAQAAELLADVYRGHPDAHLHWELQTVEGAGDFVHRVRRGAFGLTEAAYVRGILRDHTLAGVALGTEILAGAGFILQLAVLPAYRRRGLGRCLLLDVFRAFAQHGLGQVALTVSAGNPARALYRSVGMTDRAPMPAFIWRAASRPE